MKAFEPGERFERMLGFDYSAIGEGVWHAMGWEVVQLDPGSATLQWKANTDHAFPSGDGWIVHGGLVATVLDTAMGQATMTLLDNDEVFLTADLHTEFYRPTVPGTLRATARVVHKTKRLTYAAAELLDLEDTVLAAGRVTNVTLEARKRNDS